MAKGVLAGIGRYARSLSLDPEFCRLCRARPADSYEHVPPRKALNDQPTRAFGIIDWLARAEDGLRGGTVEQRGAGGVYLCERCNNNTGSWYGKELVVAAASGARILSQLPLDELDAKTEPTYVEVRFKQSETGPHPLRFIKQVVTMLLAVSPVTFSEANPELSEFVLDRDRVGLDSRYQFHLALFAGPNARTVGGALELDDEHRRETFVAEIAYPPFAYVMTVDADPEAIETVNVTECTQAGYDQRADLAMQMLVGFGHTAIPVDYRTKAMVERDRKQSEAFAREHGIEERASSTAPNLAATDPEGPLHYA